MSIPFVSGLSRLQLLLFGVAAVTCLFWGRINLHLSYHAGDPIAAFSQAGLPAQMLIALTCMALLYMSFDGKIRYWVTYTFWSEQAAQDREKEQKRNEELLRSVCAATNAVIASTSGSSAASRC